MNSENQSSSDNFPSNPKHTLLKLLLDKKNISFNAQPIPRQDEKSPIPLSFAQERLWFFNQLEGASATYNMPAAIRITGKLNTTAFQQALAEIVRRHQILHTSFQTVEDGPIQFINPNATIEIQITDLQHQDTTESEATIHQLAKQEALTPFDLKTAPLIRCSLLQLSPTEHVVLLTMHHIVSDAWSIGVLIQELSVLYPAFVAGLASPLPELPIQYADFAVWQRKYLSGEFLDNQLNYWHSQLQGAPDLLQLPTDRSRPSIQTYQGKTQSFTLSSRLNQQLQTLSQKFGTTLFMTLFGAFTTLLYRYSGQTDILIGSSVVNRNRSEIESLIGLFVNTLVLRTRFEENPSFEQLLSQVRETTLQAYEHQDVPFEKVVEAIKPQRSLSHSPLFQVMFVLQNAPLGELALPGITLSTLSSDNTIAKFDLTLSMAETPDGLVGSWGYNTDLFDSESIERMAGHFENLLSAIVSNPQQLVSEIPLLSAAERHQLLVEWNDTAVEYPKDKCIHQLFEEQVEKTPDAVAVVFEEQELTYRQLNQRANQLAHHLHRLGVKPEVLVGICVERSLEMVVGLLGILKAGGAYVPLDPSYPQERLSYMLSDSGAKVLLTQNDVLASLPLHTAQVLCLDTDWAMIEQQSYENCNSAVRASNLAYAIYTSGSTGQPKGVAIEQKSILNYVLSIINTVHIEPSSNFALVSTISADLGNTVIFPCFLTGGCIHIISKEKIFDRNAISEYFLHNYIDYLKIAPSHLAALQSLSNSALVLPSKALVIGGEVSKSNWIETIQNLCHNCNIINHYSPTECTVGVLTYFLDKTSLPLSSPTLPLGRPIANAQMYILDKQLQPVPIGLPGELHIGGDGLARGYLNRPELTAEKFIPNPFAPDKSARLYKTGDLVRYLPDGNIEYLGRIDNQVKIRGFRIELGEIESALNTHPLVQQAVAIAIEDSCSGNKRLVAYVVPNNESLSTNQLREYLHQKLPTYMVPAIFVTIDTLPLTLNGKVDRKSLPVPDGEISREHEYVAPSTSIEETLTNIWQELLLKERVGIHDNFFEIGGDSILSIQVVSRARNAGIQITPKQVFQNQTIAELARVANTTVSVIAQQGIVTGTAPLTPIQHWLLEPNNQDIHHYNQAILLQVPNHLQSELIEIACKKLLEHHDVLRLQFRLHDSEYEQINQGYDDEALLFSVVDLSSTSKVEQPQAIAKISTELQSSSNLASGSSLQVVMFELGDTEDGQILIILHHHLGIDGMSWRILLTDLVKVYQQLTTQESIQLSPKTTAFISWAENLNNYACTEIIREELDYWVNQSWSNSTSLPLDRANIRRKNTVDSTVIVSTKLSEEETYVLLNSVNEAYNTQINDILISALTLTLIQWTGNHTVLIHLRGHGREELFEDVDLSRTVGWFTSIFPVLLHLYSLDLATVIKSIKEQLRAIPNRGIGHGILRYLSKDTDVKQQLQSIPNPEINFNYLGQFDQVGVEIGWKFATKTAGINQNSNLIRHHLLDINSLVVEGELQINWIYSTNFHERVTIDNLANSYLQSIRALIKHCQSEDTFGYTPSDFPLAQLNQKALNKLIEKIN